MIIDLILCVPVELAETAKYEDLWETAQNIKQWEERQARVLDFIYRFQLTNLLSKPVSNQELEAFSDHLDQMTHPILVKQLSQLSQSFAERWQGFRDIIEDRLETRYTPVPDVALNRTHVVEILELIHDEGSITQKELQEALGLQEANTSRILTNLSNWELIYRRKVGRVNHITLGIRAEELDWIKSRKVKKQEKPSDSRESKKWFLEKYGYIPQRSLQIGLEATI